MTENLIIKTNRLILRPYQSDDADELFNICTDKNVKKYIPEEEFAIDDIRRIIKWSMDCMKKNTKEKIYKINLLIFMKKSMQPVGNCGLGPNDIHPDKIEIYYAIKEKYWGNGIGTEIAGALFQYGFEELGLDTIVTDVHPENKASIRILEKFGMRLKEHLDNLDENLSEFEGYLHYSLNRERYREVTLIYD